MCALGVALGASCFGGAGSAPCVRGDTRACVGPGNCQGGQRCLDDSTGFGPCECDSTVAGDTGVDGAGGTAGGNVEDGGPAAVGGDEGDAGALGGNGGSDGGGGGGGSGGVVSGGEGGVGGVGGSGGVGGVGGNAGAGGTGGDGGGGIAATPGLGCPSGLNGGGDYAASGPFEVQMEAGTGPGGTYTLFRPVTLGSGVRHPIASWGNGFTAATPTYAPLLTSVASHGFVVIASNSVTVTGLQILDGLDWLIAQDQAAGALQGHLATDCGVLLGHSWGATEALTVGDHPSVRAVVAMHPYTGSAGAVAGPLLLMGAAGDGIASPATAVQSVYASSDVQPTLMATLQSGDHFVPTGDGGEERAPLIAWLSFWVYGDAAGRPWFFGPSCTLCELPWTDIQRKNTVWD